MRFTLEMNDKMSEIVKTVAQDEQISQSELFRKAVLTYAVLQRETAQGKTVAIAKDGKIEKELVLTI